MNDNLNESNFYKISEFFNQKKTEFIAYCQIQLGLWVGRFDKKDLDNKNDLVTYILDSGETYFINNQEMNKESIYRENETIYMNFFNYNAIPYILSARNDKWIVKNLTLLSSWLEKEITYIDRTIIDIISDCLKVGQTMYLEVLYTK